MRQKTKRFGRQPSALTDADGRIWFPTLEGVAIVDPDALENNNIPPPVEIESVLIDRENVAYEKFCPEWVLMDVEMKEKDGFTATREIIRLHPEAKILILTKHKTERMRLEAERAGACQYVLKENLLSIRGII